jgi:nucleotidyltransferase substrate binding protein (TIGR01987 family)
MDQTLKLKLREFKQALDTLFKALKVRKSELVRDSVIKRFEYTYELLWKCAKIFLSDKYGIEVFSPKDCFRALKKVGLIKERETELFLEMVDDRNEIIHTYKEKFSEYLYKKIKKNYFVMMDNIYKIIKNNI